MTVSGGDLRYGELSRPSSTATATYTEQRKSCTGFLCYEELGF